MSTQVISNGAMGFMGAGYMPIFNLAMSAEGPPGKGIGVPGIVMPAGAFNAGPLGGAGGLPPQRRDIYEYVISTYRMPVPRTDEIPTKPDGRRISLFQRWLRRGYRREVDRFEARKHELALAAAAGRREVAADAMFTLGWLMWDHSQSDGVGLWGEAEDAWIKGALIFNGRNPFEVYGLEAYAKGIVPILLGKRIIAENTREGVVAGDDYIVRRNLGRGSDAIVHKVFGSDTVIKTYDGGAWQCSVLSLESGWWGESSSGSISSQVRHQVEGLNAVVRMGLGAARVHGHGDDFIVREFVPGITLSNAELILGARRLNEAHGLYRDFMDRVDDSPYRGTLDKKPFNFVYTEGDEVGKGRLTLIDY